MNIDLGQKQDLTSYRKIAIASWRHPRDPNAYTMLDLPVEPALSFLQAYESATPLTLTHYVTKIGALGIENAFIPLSPYSRCPLLIGIGKPRRIPIVRGDEVVAANSVIITFTFDHRYADGAHGSHLMRRFKKIFADPSAFRHVFEGEP